MAGMANLLELISTYVKFISRLWEIPAEQGMAG